MAFIPPVIAAISASAAATSTAAATAGIAATGAAGIETASIPLAAAAATATPWMAYAGLGITALSGATGAIGAIQQGNAQKASADYNASVAKQNADQANNNATMASQAGSEQVAIQQQRTRAQVGEIQANQAASGLDVNSGSAVDVRSSAAETGQLDALTVRSNATREAYGYQTQATNFEGQSELDKSEGEYDKTAGEISAGNTLLGAVGSGASNFAKYQMAGGFGF